MASPCVGVAWDQTAPCARPGILTDCARDRGYRRREALARFEELLKLATPLGLYGEEMDPATRAHLGHFPQALSHAALVQAALALRG